MNSSARGIFLHDLCGQMKKSEHFESHFFSYELNSFSSKSLTCGGIFGEEHTRFTGKCFLVYMLEINTAYGSIIFRCKDNVLIYLALIYFIPDPVKVLFGRDRFAVIVIADNAVGIPPSKDHFGVRFGDGTKVYICTADKVAHSIPLIPMTGAPLPLR